MNSIYGQNFQQPSTPHTKEILSRPEDTAIGSAMHGHGLEMQATQHLAGKHSILLSLSLDDGIIVDFPMSLKKDAITFPSNVTFSFPFPCVLHKKTKRGLKIVPRLHRHMKP